MVKTKKKIVKDNKSMVSKKVVTKKAVANKSISGKDLLKNLDKPFTRGQQISHLAEATKLPKKDVASVLQSLESMVNSHLKQLSEISLGGWFKITVIKKPATKAREGISPFTGQPMIFKAKPAKKVVKIRALKKIKDMVV